MPSYKKLSQLFVVDAIKGDFRCGTIKKVIKKPRKRSHRVPVPWYLKQTDNVKDEVIAQELFRLFIPYHPKYREVENDYVMAKQVQGYRSFANIKKAELKAGIKNGTFTGLGDVLVISMLLNDVDLRLSNLCLDEQNRIIKIDGGCSFAEGYWKKKYDITAGDIKTLPYVKDYEACNWLDMIEKDMCVLEDYKTVTKESEIVDPELSTDLSFREEVNRAILKSLIMPEELLKKFISHYVARNENIIEKKEMDEIEMYYHKFDKRRQQLKRAILQNQSFCQYMKSAQAEDQLNKYIKELTEFKMTEKRQLPVGDYENDIYKQFRQLREDVMLDEKKKSEEQTNLGLFCQTGETLLKKFRSMLSDRPSPSKQPFL